MVAEKTVSKSTKKKAAVKDPALKTSFQKKIPRVIAKSTSPRKRIVKEVEPSQEVKDINRILGKFQDNNRFPNGYLILRSLLRQSEDCVAQFDFLQSDDLTQYIGRVNKPMLDLLQIAIEDIKFRWVEFHREEYEPTDDEPETKEGVPIGFLKQWIEGVFD